MRPSQASALYVLPLAGLVLTGASFWKSRTPEVAAAPEPLSAPEPVTGSPAVAVAPEPLEAPPAQPPPRAAAPVRTDRLRLTGLMDRDVVGPDKLDIGHVIDILVDPDGQPRAVLVETGGFLGIGNRKIAIDWTGLSFPEHKPGGPIRTSMTIDQVRSAPAFAGVGPVTVAVGAALPPQPPGPPEPATAPLPLAPVANGTAREPPPPVAASPAPLPPPRAKPPARAIGRTR